MSKSGVARRSAVVVFLILQTHIRSLSAFGLAFFSTISRKSCLNIKPNKKCTVMPAAINLSVKRQNEVSSWAITKL